MNRFTALTLLALLLLSAPSLAQEITIGSDGIVRCKDVPIGTTQTIGFSTYEVADRDLIIQKRDQGNDLSLLCVSNITNMDNLLDLLSKPFVPENFAANWKIANWDVSNVQSMRRLFRGADGFNTDISKWDVSQVNDMYGMFMRAYDFNQDIGGWDVSKVTNMAEMFAVSTSFNQDLDMWDVSKVTNISDMFNGANSFNGDINSWDVSSVRRMSATFRQAFSFNQDISIWNVSSVINMNGMFETATEFNQDISNWDVASARSMDRMFHQASSFDQNLSGWCVRNISQSPTYFYDTNGWMLPRWGTCPGLPNQVVLSSPSDNAEVDFSSTTFSWETDPLATKYNFQIVTATGASIVDTETAEPSFSPASAIPSQTTYFWRVAAVNENKMVGGTVATGDWSEVRQFTTASGVDTESLELPETFVLKAAYPNPFNPTTTVTYGVPAAAEVRITATDLLGRQVATLVSGDMRSAGYHTVQFNADGLASGTYLIRMEAGDFVATQQVVLLK